MSDSISSFALPVPGDLLAGKYRIERLIGKGGMGAVFSAQHEVLFQRVALKLLLAQHAHEPGSVARFLNEARAMAQIQDEHVARVMDVGTLENGTAFMVLEFLDGVDLSEVVRARGPLPLPEAIDYAVQALEALGQAHRLGIVHRDIKPSNLFLARRPNGSHCVKLLDFGISKAANPLAAQSSALTSTGAVMGSPAYMSPEQIRNTKNVDARTDIWSLGVVIHELLHGKSPFAGETLGQVLAAIVEAEVPPLARADVPPAFETVLLRCMARKPEQRFASAADLAEALRPFASPVSLASIDRLCAKNPAPWVGAATVAHSFQSPADATAALPPGQAFQTGGAWAPRTGSQAGPTPRKTRGGLFVGVGVAIALVGLTGGLLLRKPPSPHPSGVAAGVASVSPGPAVSPPLIEPTRERSSTKPAPEPPVAAAPPPLYAAVDAGSASGAAESATARDGISPHPEPPPAEPRHSHRAHPLRADHPTPGAPAPVSTYDPTQDSRK